MHLVARMMSVRTKQLVPGSIRDDRDPWACGGPAHSRRRGGVEQPWGMSTRGGHWVVGVGVVHGAVWLAGICGSACVCVCVCPCCSAMCLEGPYALQGHDAVLDVLLRHTDDFVLTDEYGNNILHKACPLHTQQHPERSPPLQHRAQSILSSTLNSCRSQHPPPCPLLQCMSHVMSDHVMSDRMSWLGRRHQAGVVCDGS